VDVVDYVVKIDVFHEVLHRVMVYWVNEVMHTVMYSVFVVMHEAMYRVFVVLAVVLYRKVEVLYDLLKVLHDW